MGKKKASEDKYQGRIGVLRFKVIGTAGDWKADRARWRELAEAVKRVTNHIWARWLVEHDAAGSPEKVRQYIETNNAWHNADKATRGPKPKSSVYCWTPEIQKRVYASAIATYPILNARPMALVIKLIQETGKSAGATKSAYPRWMRILADEGEYPSSSKPMPIPFDRCNAPLNKWAPPDTAADNWKIQVRLDRFPRPGKPDAPADSTPDVLTLQTRGRRCAGQAAGLWKILSGEWKYMGSRLVYAESTRDWFVHICYRTPKPERAKMDPNKTAYLQPACDRPWNLWADGWPRWVGGKTGRHIRHVRRQLLTQRWGRQEGYKVATSARKGHGRRRALDHAVMVLRRRWHDFVKTQNEGTVNEALEYCVGKGIGKLMYYQPVGRKRLNRFLSRAGKVQGRTDASLWDWFQVKSMLGNKCQELGIELVVKEYGNGWTLGVPSNGKPKTRKGAKPRGKKVTTGRSRSRIKGAEVTGTKG